MDRHTFSISQRHAMLRLNKKGQSRDDHYPILHRLLNFMKSRGFEVGRDTLIQKNYKCLNKDHWYGRKGFLEFKASRYPAGFDLEFFQNVVFENPHGGCYDFDKYKKMPYLIKLLFRNEMKHAKAFLEYLNCIDISDTIYKYAVDKIKQRFVDSWHHPQKSMDEFELKDLVGLFPEESYNHTDRDKKIIRNGDVKYFRSRGTGRLMRGVAYHNINNMWWVLLNKTEYTNVADFELFDPTAEDYKARRLRADKKPIEYILRKEKIQETSTKELINELKRRRLKIVV